MATRKIYDLQTTTTMENKEHNIRKITVGTRSNRLISGGTGKILMLVGATGAGKSTLINGLVNYIMGVNYEDDHRYKLVDDGATRSQAHSQTKWITAYKFYKTETKLPYKITIIDTPGYGDTEGIERDKKITKQIKEFFSMKGNESIDQLNGIGFVVQASLPRLTTTQKYIFDSILSIFGKDISKSIFMMVTFADGKKPPVLIAIKEAKVEFQKSFKFNNSALFPDDGDDDDDDDFNEMYWKMGQKSFENFFVSFGQAKSVSLKLTREVLDEREELECVANGLQPQIMVGLHILDRLHQEEKILKLHEKDLLTNKDFEYEVEVIKHRKLDLPRGEYVTNCVMCHVTCHYPCLIARDEDKFHCSVIKPRETCNICPGKCHWKHHFNNGYRFEFFTEKETKTSEELKKRYQEAKSKKMEKEKIMEGISKELEDASSGVFFMISRARASLERLKEIALKPNPLSEVDYIDLLIEGEKMEAKEGWKKRVKAYKEVRKQAEILSKIKDKETIEKKKKWSVENFFKFFQGSTFWG